MLCCCAPRPPTPINTALYGYKQRVIRSSGGISAELIAQIIDEDEYEVKEVLENWLEFLQQQQIGGETLYSLYHSSFRDWLFIVRSGSLIVE